MATGGQVKGADLSLVASYDSGALPVANDLVAVPAGFEFTNFDTAGAGLKGKDLDLLKLGRGRSNDFGSEATPIDAVADEMNIEGTGKVFINCGDGALTTDQLFVSMGSSGIRCVFGSSGTSKWKAVDLNRGDIEFSGSALFDAAAEIRVGQVAGLNDVQLAFGSAATAIPRLDLYSGTSKSNREVTLLDMLGPSSHTQASFPVVTAFVGAGCTLIYNHKAIANDTLRIVVGPGGRLDMMQNTEPKVLDSVLIKKGGDIDWLNRPKMHTITDFKDENDQ